MRGVGHSQDMVRMSPVVFRHIPLMLTRKRVRPRSRSMRIKTPTLPVVHTSVLLSGNGTVNLIHGINDQLYVVFLRHCSCEGTIGTAVVGCEDGSGTGPVEIVGGVTERTDTWDIGTAAATKDRVLDLFPEAGLVEELHIRSALEFL